MSWEYRVVQKVTKIPLGETDITYEIHDVYLDESLDIVNIGRLSFPMGDDVESLQWSLERMMEACSKPVIDYKTGEEVNEEKD
jgi:hypothetical protein